MVANDVRWHCCRLLEGRAKKSPEIEIRSYNGEVRSSKGPPGNSVLKLQPGQLFCI